MIGEPSQAGLGYFVFVLSVLARPISLALVMSGLLRPRFRQATIRDGRSLLARAVMLTCFSPVQTRLGPSSAVFVRPRPEGTAQLGRQA